MICKSILVRSAVPTAEALADLKQAAAERMQRKSSAGWELKVSQLQVPLTTLIFEQASSNPAQAGVLPSERGY